MTISIDALFIAFNQIGVGQGHSHLIFSKQANNAISSALYRNMGQKDLHKSLQKVVILAQRISPSEILEIDQTYVTMYIGSIGHRVQTFCFI